MSFTAVIADNHDVTRWGVQSAIEGMRGQVVTTAETGLDAVSAIDDYAPDVLVLSLRLPHLNGLDVLYYLQEQSLSVRSVVLTTYEEKERVREVFERGGHAYVRKRDSLEEVCAAIRAVCQGERYLSDALPDACMVEPGAATQGADVYRMLTMREREVVQMTAEGYTSKEVSRRLDISPRTVEKHRENIKRKLGLRSVVEMAEYACQRGFLPDPRLLHTSDRSVA